MSEVMLLGLMGHAESSFVLHERIKSESLFKKCGPMTSRYPIAVHRLRKYLQRNHVDVLVVVESSLSFYAIPARFGLKTRLICWEHFNFNADGGRKKRVVARYLAAMFADDVVTLTRRDQALWEQRTCTRANIGAIANPVGQLNYEPIYPVGSRTVLAVGRLDHQKGFDILLEAWACVVERDHAASWNLVIVGNGELRKSLDEQIVRLDLDRSVTIHPATSDIRSKYAQAAIVCCSSRYEGLPMVLIEAQQHGVPVVSFDVDTGPREIVLNGETGLLVPPEDRESLANALCDLMSDERKRSAMSKSAIRHSTRFHTENVIEHWRRLLALPSSTCESVDCGHAS
ncbi:glycosyltransferase family 4 protein [Paraburkholderia pallida]|uniref:glycosyltransferase family 4 protein n=1 Tax=Paraburkholderia pallida TaxID=2547399 RepID=UPI00143017CE|nr:glycosyltransferase family 4 protein [Paraburkholderia pallida]